MQRVHGGALPKAPSEISYRWRERQSKSAKTAIAAMCLGLLRPDMVIVTMFAS